MSAFLIYLFRIFHLLPSGSNDKYLEAEYSFKVPFFKEPNYVAHLSEKNISDEDSLLHQVSQRMNLLHL